MLLSLLNTLKEQRELKHHITLFYGLIYALKKAYVKIMKARNIQRIIKVEISFIRQKDIQAIYIQVLHYLVKCCLKITLLLWFYGGLFKLNIALAVLVVLKTPTCSILNYGLLYKTNSTTNSTHKEKKQHYDLLRKRNLNSFWFQEMFATDFSIFFRNSGIKVLYFVFESESNQFFLFCQVAILCWVPSTFTSSVM